MSRMEGAAVRTMRMLPWLLLFAASTLACSRRPQTAVMLEEPGYSIQMPAPFTKRVDEQELGRVSIYIAKVGSRVFEMAYSDNLRGVELSPDEMLGALQSVYVGGDVVMRQAVVELDGYPGRSLEIKGRGMIRFLRLYSVERRAYHISVLSREADASEPEAEDFFRTFQLRGPVSRNQ